ncbi:MAG: hypothetical protein R3C25_00045 [Hyphomonadaceae bacterium]
MRFRGWRDFRTQRDMAQNCPTPSALRAEARVLAVAGLVLLALGFPVTLFLVARALAAGAGAPFLPLAVGAPPIMLGYLACHFASQRMVRAKALEAANEAPALAAAAQ